ncbi:hypothetical protein [Candidatus Uabimicrobium sp. HlEnr_7]|uniref:hypothetical protein n=1 Tax=Candidatus Uabimicrobium helgolandensis TaxID=3095367 RepID=UPI003557666A
MENREVLLFELCILTVLSFAWLITDITIWTPTPIHVFVATVFFFPFLMPVTYFCL